MPTPKRPFRNSDNQDCVRGISLVLNAFLDTLTPTIMMIVERHLYLVAMQTGLSVSWVPPQLGHPWTLYQVVATL